ncbi:tagatose-6-phosphate kinase [Staphylococcus agnetis]|nr:hexose kinase [Staphylococcus agnetis]PNY85491.1 tagatose-6-phosphate kinase [Staphylococcus agnetis]PTH31154.1 tagatose-6-phosphate kinase [Staphylococcus agnetis]PTH68513.1 tagatose-6-phosphate kinase [Staphylococcus agnetis]PTH69189.1 tagatose-6-phosphate kinase [Staphylococcus agnetis]
MISMKKVLTVTLNASIDISYHMEELRLDTTNRVTQVSKTAGGKGLNVTRVGHQLGLDITASGIVGGTSGLFIKQQLDRLHIPHQFLDSGVESRFCIAMITQDAQTEVLESGIALNETVQEQFVTFYDTLIKDYDIIAISGSIPPGLSVTMYQDLIDIAKRQNKFVILDVNGATLATILKQETVFKPDLIKPNEEEIAELTGNPGHLSIQSLQNALNQPIFNQLPNVLVTLGKDGALLKHHSQFYQVNIPSINAVNAVGSGDSSIAGFCSGLVQSEDIQNATKRAMAAGMANAMQHETGKIDMHDFETLLSQITIQPL